MSGKFTVNNNKFSHIGGGSYGEVYRAFDVRGFNSAIAIKRNLVDKNINFNVTVRELDILILLRGHPNIVNLIGISFNDPFRLVKIPNPPNKMRNDNIYFIFENADCDLATYITNNELSIETVKSFTRDILLGVNYIHRLGLIHRDIKTSNLLVFNDNGKLKIKICDFGFTKQNITHLSSPKIVTSWYRCPEVCCQLAKYNHKIDVWSMGCVIYEMMTRKPLCNNCDDDDRSIISYICAKLPAECFYGLSKDLKTKIINISNNPIPTNDNNFKASIPSKFREQKQLYQLMIDMLMIDPDKRIDTTIALNNDFIYCDEIEDILSSYNTNLKFYIENTIIKIPDTRERQWYADLAFAIYNNRKNISWYSHDIIFQSLSLMDRYMSWMIEKKQSKKEDGNYHSEDGVSLRFVTCLYLSIKYFQANSYIPSFEALTNTRYKDIEFALQFETFLISEVLHYKIFNNTLLEYETFRKNRELESVEVCELLTKFGMVKKYDGNLKNFHRLINK